MNTETKRHIDAARQVLVGVVPNPTSQIDQITNALIYKFMDDMDQSAIKQGGNESFFIGDLKPYAWTTLMNPRIGNQERMNIYSEALIKFSESKQLPALFREIFKSAFLPYRSPEVLGLFLKEISYFDYSHPEELGNAYEYLLSIMSSQGDAGQFRTPRHIIDFIVDVVDPTPEDKVLDPACGTGGFLVSAYKHISEKHDGKNPDGTKNDEKPLGPEQRKNLMGNFEGYDIDPGMVRIAQVNMYLHQFKNPKIFQYDSLSMDERWGDKFSVILANPPFMSPRGGVSTHSKFSIQSSRSEVLFVDYIMNHLRPNGRAGIIVPEGIIFQSGTVYKQLRKNLVEDGLYAVVSLPSGVFNPYAGVKTSILLFNNELAKQSKEILFVKIENDGFDLGAQRRAINKNDLPQALKILKEWQKDLKLKSSSDGLLTENGDNLTTETGGKILLEQQIAHAVSREKIAEGGDYNLSGDRYRIIADHSNAKWPMVELGEVININFGERITKNNQQGTKYPVYGGGGESFRTDNFNRQNEYVIARFAMSANCVRYVSGQFWMMDSGGTFSVNKEYENRLNKDFVGNILLNKQIDIFMCARGGAQKNLNTDHFYELKIPLPPLEIQEQIVKELDGYQNIITGAEQIIFNWKPVIEIDPMWEEVNLEEACEIQRGKFSYRPRNEPRFFGGEYPFIQTGDIVRANGGKIKYTQTLNEDGLSVSKLFKPPIVVITIAANIGDTAVLDFSACFPDSVIGLTPKSKTNASFLELIMQTKKKYLNDIAPQAAQKNINIEILKTIKIPLPPIEIQKQIVERIESERVLAEGNKKLIEIYKQKIKDTLAKLWEE